MTDDDAFLHWLAGFIDGEGCFIVQAHSGLSFSPRFAVRLRDDDRAILEEIVAKTGIGRIGTLEHTGGEGINGKPAVIWWVSSKADMARLIRILDDHPLRAKKRRDFEVWRRAVRVHATTVHGQHSPAVAWRLKQLKRELEAVRLYSPDQVISP